MKNRTLLLILTLLVALSCTAFAANERRTGTAGGQELLIPVGSRGTALGGAVIASARGVESIFWNPAGLASLEGTEAAFSHMPYLADIDVNFGGVATAIEGFGTIAFGAKVVSIGDMIETTEEYPDGTGRVFNPTMSVLSFSFAKQLTTSVAFGATGMYINESIFEVSASGVAFDVGFTYDPRWRGLQLGMVVKNYGPEASFSGRGFDRDVSGRAAASSSASFDLPSFIALGASIDLINQGENSVAILGNFQSNNFRADQFQGGAEYSFNDRYFLRAGYNFSEQGEWLYGASFGAGLNVPIGTANLGFDYSWTETDVFDDNQVFSLRIAF
ncbi:MAG: PorV/PorQ family protein [bacterium]|nr:PorV/PorQ family protein [bacterium]